MMNDTMTPDPGGAPRRKSRRLGWRARCALAKTRGAATVEEMRDLCAHLPDRDQLAILDAVAREARAALRRGIRAAGDVGLDPHPAMLALRIAVDLGTAERVLNGEEPGT